jgi:hypothetical protein
VIMALVTTMATTPVLHFIMSGKDLEREAKSIASSESMVSQRNRVGILVPVSHPSGVRTLLSFALNLNPQGSPPPRVLALIRGGEEGIGALRDLEEPAPSQSPALAAALDLAWARGAVITPQTVWTTDPATDILHAVEESQVRWLFLESRQPILTSFSVKATRKGVIGKVLARALLLPVNVAVLFQNSRPLEGAITCIIQARRHGLAALELGRQLSQARNEILRIVRFGSVPEDWHDDLSNEEISLITTGVSIQRSDAETVEAATAAAQNGIVIVGADIPNQMPVLSDSFTRARSVVVVQGAAYNDLTLDDQEQIQAAAV